MRGENAATPGREYGRFYTGSHSKTILYGLITTDGRGMFRTTSSTSMPLQIF